VITITVGTANSTPSGVTAGTPSYVAGSAIQDLAGTSIDTSSVSAGSVQTF
jgi:hypothetical protein